MIKLVDRARARFPDTDKVKVTETLIAEIKNDLASDKNTPVKIATRLGVPVALVRFISNEMPQPSGVFLAVSEDGWGREELRPYIVARKRALSDSWDAEDEAALQKARDNYDAGIVEMAQGRDGIFIIQYAFPRRKHIKRDMPWFKLEEEFS